MPLKYCVFIQLNSFVRSWYYAIFFFLKLAWCEKNNLFWKRFMTKKGQIHVFIVLYIYLSTFVK